MILIESSIFSAMGKYRIYEFASKLYLYINRRSFVLSIAYKFNMPVVFPKEYEYLDKIPDA